MFPDLILSLVLAAGCGGTPMDQQLPVHRGRKYARPLDTLGVESAVPAAAAQVWSVLPSVFAELGLEVNFREPATRRLGTCYQRVRHRLGKHQLSNVMDCGEKNSLPNADRYEVALTVLTTVRVGADGNTLISTFMLGVALDASGAASNRIWCYSKGGLEEIIRLALEERTRA